MLRLILPFIVLVSVLGAVSLTSCKKTVNFSSGNLTFSKDTVVFDTVFTTIGSTTQQFKFYNNDSRTINVQEVELMGGDNSPFRVNVDGIVGTNFENIEIEGNDSLFVFVEVTLEVNSATNPMVIEDSIRFRTNGVDQYVNLAVWGQDMYFHNNDFVVGTWQNDKPHLIYGDAVINENTSLTIPAGTQVFLHKNSKLTNFRGTLNIEGTLGNEVVFQGDRLESLYDDVAGQFYGIYLFYAKESKINYLNIKNGTVGIHVFNEDPANTDYTLRVTNSKISNNAFSGMLLYSGCHVRAENCVISKNTVYGIATFASDFSFNHCHIVGYSSAGSQTPALGISNVGYDEVADQAYVTNINEGEITNSVVYGNLDTEFVIDTTDETNVLTFNFNFQYNLIKSETEYVNQFFSNNIWNDEPYFVSPTDNDFLYYSISPLHLNGSAAFLNTAAEPADGIGINGVVRLAPDIGAYEIP
ncbi:MAG: right-handed parallel beta-helix repeat-containing protein [Crocinitomicaceae bacterium]|nr:right-handed parallel beta-helix repeat-containing protein [Crocinitomicaceae bacterium]